MMIEFAVVLLPLISQCSFVVWNGWSLRGTIWRAWLTWKSVVAMCLGFANWKVVSEVCLSCSAYCRQCNVMTGLEIDEFSLSLLLSSSVCQLQNNFPNAVMVQCSAKVWSWSYLKSLWTISPIFSIIKDWNLEWVVIGSMERSGPSWICHNIVYFCHIVSHYIMLDFRSHNVFRGLWIEILWCWYIMLYNVLNCTMSLLEW